MTKKERLEQKQSELTEQYRLLSGKIESLLKEIATQTQPDRKFEYEEKLKTAYAERDAVEEKLEAIEQELEPIENKTDESTPDDRKGYDKGGNVSGGQILEDGKTVSLGFYNPELMQNCLNRIGLKPMVPLDAYSLGVELIAGKIIVDSSICGYEGVNLDEIHVEMYGHLENHPEHPQIILETQQKSSKPVPNAAKVHLLKWQSPIIDQGNKLKLELAWSDYWTWEATKIVMSDIQKGILDNFIDFRRFPRRADVHLVVITGSDNCLVLTKRAHHVATEANTWMVSVGESMDADKDIIQGNCPHPACTARRCLTEYDELNIPSSLVNNASLRLVALATEWHEMLINLVTLVELPNVDFGQLRQYFTRGENEILDSVPFDLKGCIKLLEEPIYTPKKLRREAGEINQISRYALLAVLFNKFGGKKVFETINK